MTSLSVPFFSRSEQKTATEPATAIANGFGTIEITFGSSRSAARYMARTASAPSSSSRRSVLNALPIQRADMAFIFSNSSGVTPPVALVGVRTILLSVIVLSVLVMRKPWSKHSNKNQADNGN